MSGLRWFPPSLIDEAALFAAVRPLPRFGNIRYSVSTDSTQLRALQVLHRLDSFGISFVTESQDMGRGRAGRSWLSPPGSGLLFSTILPRELRGASLPAVGFWASLAVADAVLNVCSITLALKWPNDLLLEGKKCAGVLSEGRSTGDVTRVVLGVGLNANRPKEVPAEIQSGAIWLSDHMGVPVDRTALLAAILTAYEERFDDLVERPTEVIARWSLRAALSGREVSVKASDGSILHAGKVLDVSSNGALVLQTKDGVVPVMLGDVDVLD